MLRQPSGLLSVLLLLGYPSLPAVPAEDKPSVAEHLWVQGQTAMHHGQPAEAITLYRQSLAADPSFARPHLSLAAAYLEIDDAEHACHHLGKYLEANPRQTQTRMRYAELLERLNRPREARQQLERIIDEVQLQGGELAEQLIPSHSRLMQMAEEAGDEYTEHLHRGIGLYLIARKRARIDDESNTLPIEGLLCKAAAELTMAQSKRPSQARPRWYLHEVWSLLGQGQPARAQLLKAHELAPFSYLTVQEEQGLSLTYQRETLEMRSPAHHSGSS